MFDCLADQHAIERILMEARKAWQVERTFFVERKGAEAVALPLPRNEGPGRCRQR